MPEIRFQYLTAGVSSNLNIIIPEDSDDEDVYADDVTDEQFRLLFRDSDDESELEGF